MAPVLLTDANNYTGRFPDYARPKVIGYFGLENLKYANKIENKRTNFDLNIYLDQAIHHPENRDVKLNDLLKFLLENQKRLKELAISAINLHDARFFCYRGLMTLIACTPYENREPWKVVVILHNGNIYLCARDTVEALDRKCNMTERDKKFTSWGYKFEQFLLSDKPGVDPNPNQPVDETQEFSLVFTTKLNKHTIVYGAEMDGILCEHEHTTSCPSEESGVDTVVIYLSTQKFVELKTNRHIEFPNQERNFRRFKTKKWWCQSFLVGIETILCGFRNDCGIVEELKIFNVKELPKMSQKFWNPNVCFNFLDSFFTFVKRSLDLEIRQKYGDKALKNILNLPLISLLFEWKPGGPVQVVRPYDHDEDVILHTWFLDNYGK